MPSLKSLCQEFGLSTKTVQHAYDVLEEEGLVYVIPSLGYFVASRD